MVNSEFPYRISIPYKDEAMGGMYTFFSYFRNYLDANGISHGQSLWGRYDVLFLNSFMTPFAQVRMTRFFHPRACIVHRIDGSAEDYGRGAQWDEIQGLVNRISDLTIFQSEYGRYATSDKFHVIGNDGPVIHNPIDTSLFRPGTNRYDGRKKTAYVSFSVNPKKGATSVYEIAKANPDIDFVLMGRFKDVPNVPNIELKGHLDKKGVADALGKCHSFLFFSENETCPNVVLEALSCGLPVLYLDSGGTSELVADAGRAVTVDTFRSAYDEITNDWLAWSKKARMRAENSFSAQEVIPKYLAAISEAVERKRGNAC